MQKKTPVILASTSPYRRAMLEAAGLKIDATRPEIDEDEQKLKLAKALPGITPSEMAVKLAEIKAASVSAGRDGRLVIGADQILSFEGEILSKPSTLAEARQHLTRLRGATHELISAVVLVVDKKCEWSYIGSARLRMRNFSDGFLDGYIKRQGSRLLSTVGAYEIESVGAQLFEAVDGDHFTIVGLPLLPLLAELRRREVLEE